VLARATACSVHGLAGVPVLVEADVANGLPNAMTQHSHEDRRSRSWNREAIA
jgi:hypothetical protein